MSFCHIYYIFILVLKVCSIVREPVYVSYERNLQKKYIFVWFYSFQFHQRVQRTAPIDTVHLFT